MRALFLMLLILSLAGCQSGGTKDAAPPTPDINGFVTEPVPGTDLLKVTKYNDQGQVLESGYLLDSLMQGTWMYFEHSTKEFPKKVINYHHGIAQGLYLEMTERGQIELQATYENNQLHGPWGIYKFGRPVKTATYKHGLLDGLYREYSATDGKLQKEIYYKDGKADGPYRYFNTEGEVTLEYEFKNGEKISGGTLEPGKDNPPK